MPAKLLAIGGIDSSGGAGLDADRAAGAAVGAEVLTAITAHTEQTDDAVLDVRPATIPDLVESILTALPDVQAVKIGMLGSDDTARAVFDCLDRFDGPIVWDPVMKASAGQSLHDGDMKPFLHRCSLLTPNVDEAVALTGHAVRHVADMQKAVTLLTDLGASNVLLKGGHIELPRDDPQVTDMLGTGGLVMQLRSDRVAGGPWRGTGCSLATLIAVELAGGRALAPSVRNARATLRKAMAAGSGGRLNYDLN